MKKLVQPAELAKASHMRPGDPRINLLTEVSGLKKLERFYNAIEDLRDLDFVAAVFRNLDLEIEVDPADLANVPKDGPLLFVSNHPYGAIDGLALVHVLGRVRPDLKVMANFLLQQLEPLRDRFIGVNPFEQLTSLSSFRIGVGGAGGGDTLFPRDGPAADPGSAGCNARGRSAAIGWSAQFLTAFKTATSACVIRRRDC